MATKNISITEEAYMRLANLRKSNESFSQIINRLTAKRRLLDFAGILSKDSANSIEKHLRKKRAAFDKERDRRRGKLLRELS
jgi:predicted CopG family antitoxin